MTFIQMLIVNDFYWFTVSGRHTCFVCKSSEGEVKQCRVAHCGKFYHLACISKYPHARIESNSISCPLHVCGTCYTENPKNPKCSKGKNSHRMVWSHSSYFVVQLGLLISKNVPLKVQKCNLQSSESQS